MSRPLAASPLTRTGFAAAVALIAFACGPTAGTPPPPSSTTAAAASGSSASGSSASGDHGWQVLFDGTAVAGLRPYGDPDAASGTLPASWTIRDGRLRTIAGVGVDLLTDDLFGNFELEFTWAVTPGGNSGVMYHVVESAEPAWTSGPEYQLLDDSGHPDGADPTTSAAALYDLIAPGPAKRLAPVGEDNVSRIVVRDGHVEHWLNGERVVAYDWRSDDVLALVAASKFRDDPAFMAADEGRVAFQHHGQEVSFGRIRIRDL
jgi:hypothetical protein